MAESTAHELELRLECLAINGDNNNNNNAVVISNVSDPPAVQVVGDADEARRGARRMAAMRRRRVKGGGGGSSKPEAKESSPTVVAKMNSVLESVTLGTTAKDIDSPRSTLELIATLGVTATTMRKGVATVDVNGISSPASDDDGVATSSLVSGDDDGAVCYLCLDGGADEADQPMRRDCACRGTDAGFVHLRCLADYAAVKSMR